MTLDQALRDAAARLAGSSDTARLDAELLLADALGSTRDALLLGDRGRPVPASFAALVERRARGEPVAYITGRRDFWTIALRVTPAVLIPRPDSETLIEAAIDHFAGRPPPRRILDLGTGSGALLLAALDVWPEAGGVGIDISAAALAVARDNAARLRMADRTCFGRGNWRGDPEADLVLCNPPYVATGETLPRDVAAHEPASALWAGADGLDCYRAIAPVIDFAEGGLAVVEIGAGQAATAGALFRAAGFAVGVRRDLAGRDRCLTIVRPDRGAGAVCDPG